MLAGMKEVVVLRAFRAPRTRSHLHRGLRCAVAMFAAGITAAAGAANVTISAQGAAGQPLVDAVLLLEPASGKAPVKPVTGAEMGQANKQFMPLVTVVTVGTQVAFPNRDTVRHHVYSFSQPKKFEIKLYVGKPENPVLFDQPGVVVLGCNIHDNMVGWIIVSDTPWYAKTPAAGRVTIADVPPGAYKLRSWHAELPVGSVGTEQMVTVPAAGLELVSKLPVAKG